MRLKLTVVLLVTVGCLVAVLWGLDLGEARAALSAASWGFLLPMAGLYTVAHLLRSLRLGILLNAGVSFRRLVTVTSIGFLAINVVPLRLGELVRPYLLAERDDVPFGRGMAAIVIERLFDMTALLVLLLGLGLVVELPTQGIVVAGTDVVAAGQRAAGTLVAAGVLFGALVVVVGEPALRILARLPMGTRIEGLARKFREGIIDLGRRPLAALACAAITVAVWAATLGAVGVTMAAFPGVPSTLAAVWTTWTVTLSGMTAMPTPGFFGSYELFCTAALWLWDVDGDVARTFSIVLHLSQFGFTVLVGGIFLVVEGMSLKDLVAAPPAVEG